MILDLHDRLRNPLRLRATRLLVRDDFDNPIALLLQLVPGHTRILTVDDPDFQTQLAQLGLEITVLVSRHDLQGQRAITPPRLES